MKWLQKDNEPKLKLGLVLPGGGARGAYQVGVLNAIARMQAKHSPTPFQIITGTSAGSINATALAIHASDFRKGVYRLTRVWKNFHANHVFRTDALGITTTGAKWLLGMVLGGLGKYNPRSLLDRSPLRQLLAQTMDFEAIQKEIDAGNLHALGITASGYNSGESVTFYQGEESIENWDRQRRVGAEAKINVDHLMASSAIPLVFSAVKINREYFGDGSMRQIAPLSPALHLGADKVLVVGIRKNNEGAQYREQSPSYPALAQIFGHVLNSIFLDSLDADLERAERINKTISLISTRRLVQGGVTLRPVDILTIHPSESIDQIASRHSHRLPWPIRFLLRGIGAYAGHGSSLVSYLLFEKEFCRELITLGYNDAMNSKDEIMAFFDQKEE